MVYIGFLRADCKNCYACARSCPVHAIKIIDDRVQIINERCIECGKCFRVCPQNAKSIRRETEMVKHYIKGRYDVVASLDPSFPGVFGKHSNKVHTVLKQLGFDYVEETASISENIINEYERHANLEDNKTYITSFCPSINILIQKYYPNLVENIIPINTPSIYHAKVLKEKYKKESKVVYIGPCLSQKNEGYDRESIDLVLTFEDLFKWIKEEKINLDDIKEEDFEEISIDSRLIPLVGGKTSFSKNSPTKKSIIQVDGLRDSIAILKEIESGKFKNSLIEMSSCRHSCVNGTEIPSDLDYNVYERKENIKRYAKDQVEKVDKSHISDSQPINIDNTRVLKSREVLLNIPSEEELKEILNAMGKYEKSDELNCGSCGYHTCREKAIAVHNNMIGIDMCLPFMRERAENLSNIILDMTPNIIVTLDKNLDILKLNPTAEKFLGINNQKAKGLPIMMFLEEERFKNVVDTKVNIYKEKITIETNNATVIQSIIWLEKNQVVVWIADDVTKDERQQEKIQNMKIDAINMAQKVINKQMVVAQEIASLLGETTAETKVTLTQLKHLVQNEERI